MQSADEAHHLLFAASFYDVPDLLRLCLSALGNLLTAENVGEALIAADRHGAEAAGLKLAALRFVKENAGAVMRSAAWRRRVPARLVNEAMFFKETGEQLPPLEGDEQDVEEDEAAAAAAGGGGRNVRQRTA